MKFLWMFFVTASTLLYQAPATSDAKQRFFEYYSGDWAGQGEFSNGSKISAHLSFRADKDIDGLLYRHLDDPPNQYRALSIWKIDLKSDQLVASIHDAFGPVRVFVSKEWKDRKLTLESVNSFGDSKFSKQRFLYEPLSEDSFKMTYQVDAGTAGWKTGDFLIFLRVKS